MPTRRHDSTSPEALRDARRSDGGAPDPASGRSLETSREARLVARAKSGDRAALAELLKAYERRVYAVCARMVPEPADAADLTQDTLVKVMEALHTFDGRSSLSTWIIRIAMNCALSHLRRQKLRRHPSLDDAAPMGVAGRREPDGASGVERSERARLLVEALGRLDAESRAILVLRDTQDLAYDQIATVLGVPLGTVKSRIFRARLALRTEMERLEGGEARAE